MTGKTHTLGGSAFALGSYLVLKKAGMLEMNLDAPAEILIILPYSIWASTVPDLDQTKLEVAMENPINLVIQKFFDFIGAGHRSFKSHVYPAVFASILAFLGIGGANVFHATNNLSITLYCMVTLGISMGLVSHTLLDMCTKSGLHKGKKRYAFVPNLDVFKTGSIYETKVRVGLYFFNIVLFALLFI